MNRRLVAVLAVAFVVGACSGGRAPTSPPASAAASPAGSAAPASLTIFAASSLKAALERAKPLYEAGHPGTTLTLSTDSSSALETKIEQGAPADVFLSADTANPTKLVNGGFAAGAAQDFASNVLTIIVPKGNPADITTPFDLARPGLKVIAAGDSVPITTYATMLVDNLARSPGAPVAFATGYRANIVTKADSVAAVVSQIELGQGDAAIVYVTDAMASGKVDSVAISPDSANVVATYAGVVVKASSQQAAAQAFLDWLVGPDGQAVLAGYGFLPSPA